VKVLGDAVLRLPKTQLDLEQAGLQRR